MNHNDTDETGIKYGRGALVQRKKDGRYCHIVNRYVDADTGDVVYRLWDPTHTHDYHYHAEDLDADFRPAGISLNPGMKPAAVFGGRINGRLVSWRSIWGKTPEEKA